MRLILSLILVLFVILPAKAQVRVSQFPAAVPPILGPEIFWIDRDPFAAGSTRKATVTQVFGIPLDTARALTDPGADRLMFWDDSGSLIDWLILGTNLSITGNTLNATGGGVTDGDKGNITVSGGGLTWTIDPDVVTFGMLQNASSASVLVGRGSAAGAGDFQEITLGANLSMAGTVLNATGGGAPGGSDTQLQFNNVGALGGAAAMTYSIANLLPTLDRVKVPYWLERDITNVTGNATFDLSGAPVLQTTNAANQTITLANVPGTGHVAWLIRLTGNAVNTFALVAPGSYTLTARWGVFSSTPRSGLTEYYFERSGTTIYYDTIAPAVLADLPSIATDSLLGRDTAGTGAPEVLTLSQALDFVGSAAQGDILYRGAATWTRLGAGTSGQILQTQGPGANPQWSNAGAGTGDFVGPAVAVDNTVVLFDGTTGKLGKQSTSAIGFGNSSAASLVVTANLSGATDPTVTYANNLVTVSSPLTSGTFTSTSSVQAAPGSSILWAGRSRMLSPADNSIQMMNNASTDFDDLIWGPATTSFPLLRATNGTFSAMLADGSAFTSIQTSTTFLGTTNTAGALALKAPLADPIFTSSLQIPNGAAPTTDAFGEIAGDNDAWAASRGAVQWFDGTANTYLVGVLANDPPTAGQVPKMGASGTITWEDDQSGSGSAPTNTVVSLSTPATSGGVGYASDTIGTNLTFSSGVVIGSNTNLQVDGAITTYQVTATNMYLMPNGTAANPAIGFESDNDGTGTGVYRVAANSYSIASNGSEKLRITQTTAHISNPLSFGTSFGSPFVTVNAEGADIFQQGVDGASPSAQTFKGPDGSGTDIAGGRLTIAGGRRTGTGAGGDVVLQTTPSATSTGSSAGTLTDRFHIVAKGKVLTDGAAVSLFEVALPTLKMAGGRIVATITCTDGTDMQSFSQEISFASVNKGAAYTSSITASTGDKAVSAGTLTSAWTILTGTDKITVQLNADTSLTPSSNSFLCYYSVFNNSEQAITIIP